MFQLCYLTFEVADVLARVRVVQLTLDLPFFFLLAEDKSEKIDNLNQGSRVRGRVGGVEGGQGINISWYRDIVLRQLNDFV